MRVRVPAKDVSRWFPAGTELRVMPAEQFDSLVRRAIEGSSRQRTAQPPRLIRARHHARWNAGVLSGRTELVIEAARSGPADFVLEPWTPAILPTAQSAQGRRCSRFGKAEPVDRSVAQPDHRARVGITTAIALRGRSFDLGASRRRNDGLDLGDSQGLGAFVSSRAAARLRWSRPTRPNRVWEIEAESGRIDLHSTTRRRASRSSGRTHGFPARRKSTCAGRRIAAGPWSTGRRTGGSSSILVIRSHWKSSSIRAWS